MLFSVEKREDRASGLWLWFLEDLDDGLRWLLAAFVGAIG